jgi:hypothetical protein
MMQWTADLFANPHPNGSMARQFGVVRLVARFRTLLGLAISSGLAGLVAAAQLSVTSA